MRGFLFSSCFESTGMKHTSSTVRAYERFGGAPGLEKYQEKLGLLLGEYAARRGACYKYQRFCSQEGETPLTRSSGCQEHSSQRGNRS